jgi:nucleotide-binding universal stress UspA family protein
MCADMRRFGNSWPKVPEIDEGGSSRPTAMAHHAPCPVLVARADRDFPSAILHADDGSPESLAAAQVAARLATRRNPSTLVTLHVGEGHGEGVSGEAAEIIAAAGVEPVSAVSHERPERATCSDRGRVHACVGLRTDIL